MREGALDRLLAEVLALTYTHRADAFRPLPEGGEERIWRDRPCALSRSALVTAPEPPDAAYILPEARYRLALFTGPEAFLRLGDRAEIRDGTGRVFRGRASDSFRYPSHCVTVLEVSEVTEPGGGQDSPEPGEKRAP